MNFDLVIRGGQCVVVDPATGELKTEVLDIGILGGRIQKIGSIGAATGAPTIEAQELTVLPGVIDSQVHFREPGMTQKEDFASGTLGAILGGVTMVFEMPNTKPPTTTAIDLHQKIERATGRAWCDFAFFMGASSANADRLFDLEKLPGCCSVKVFVGSSTGDLLVESDELIRRVLQHTRKRIAFHSEDEYRLRERKKILEHAPRVHMHPEWRDELVALQATRRVLSIARDLSRQVHILHVTTAGEMELFAQNRDLATVEVTPQHLTLAAPECYDRLGTLAQMNPPIRDRHHQEALWKALQAGIVDVIGTDHAPHTLEEKAQAYPASPSGMPGVQTLVPIMLNHVHENRLSLTRLVELICRNPARLYGLQKKGEIRVGNDADLTLVDLKRQQRIENAAMATKCGWTPYDGMSVTGWPLVTVVRGKIVMRDGQALGQPSGQPGVFQGPVQ